MSPDDPKLRARLEQLRAEVNQQHTTKASRTPPEPQAPANTPGIALFRELKSSFWLPLQILAIPWTQEIIDQVFFRGRWNLPVHPRSWDGIPGIFFSAFSHGDFGHLIANSIAFVTFSWLILVKSRKDFWITFLVGWLGGGLATWLFGLNRAHGLSGVVYTLFGYLLVIGWLERRFVSLLVSVFILLNYSAVIWGIFPRHPGIAWWGHLYGFLLGIFAAYGVYREPK